MIRPILYLLVPRLLLVVLIGIQYRKWLKNSRAQHIIGLPCQSKNATFFRSDTIRVNSSTNREGPSPTSKT